MVIDLKSIMIDNFSRLYENYFALIVIASILGILIFVLRHDIEYHLDLTRRDKKKLIEKTLLFLSILGIATIGYLFIQGHFFILACIISIILIYPLYLLGFFDGIVEKWG